MTYLYTVKSTVPLTSNGYSKESELLIDPKSLMMPVTRSESENK